MPWTLLSLPGPVAALALRERTALIALEDGRVVRSVGGATWEPVVDAPPAAVPVGLVLALLAAPSALVLATAGGLLRAPMDAPWRPTRGLPPDAAALALATDGGALVAGTHRHGVFRSLDGGATWAPASLGLPYGGAGLEVHAVVASPHGLYAAHTLGLSRSDDGGRQWGGAGIGLPLLPARYALAATGREVYAEAAGRLFGTTDGASWAEVYDGPALGRPLVLVGAGGGTLFGVDPAGALARSADGGASWQGVGGLPGPPSAVVAGSRGVWAALGAQGVGYAPPARRGASGRGVAVHLDAGNPNPFTTWTDLAFSISAPAEIVLSIHDAQDVEVARVAEGRFAAGRHRVRFQAQALPSGFYRFRLTAGGRSQARPLVLIK